MARNLEVGERVYVPCSRVDGLPDQGVSLYRTKIVQVQGRRVKVDLPGGRASNWIGVPLIHRDVGIMIFNIGDLSSETTLLDPLAKSIGQFCRLLVGEDQIRQIRVRSLAELKKVWVTEQKAYSHVVWIAHGSPDGIRFAVNGWVTAEELNSELRIYGAPKKTFISLCCKHGYKSFGAEVSRTAICKHFMGPFHSVQGAVASQFCQTFLAAHFLEGRTAGVAFNKARSSVPGTTSFRLWTNGRLKAGPK